MSDPLIRPAGDGDMERIAALYGHHVLHGTATFEEVPPPVEEIRRRFQAIVAAGLPYLIAEIDGRIVGYSYVGPYRPRAAYRHTGEDSIYLDPDFMRRGIGSALLEALFEPSRRQGIRQIVAVIGDTANLASIRLHERHGFRHAGVLNAVGFKFGRWIDSVLMQKGL